MSNRQRGITTKRAPVVLFVAFLATTSFYHTPSAAQLRTLSPLVAKTAAPQPLPISIVPRPREMHDTSGEFQFPARARIAATTPAERDVAAFLIDFLHDHGLQGELTGAGAPAADIRLVAAANTNARVGPEGYALQVAPAGITITANTGRGLYYGLQTLEQMTQARASGGMSIGAATVQDWPAYPWRGIHLDVSRHFYTVAVIKRYLDVAAHYKLNTFHWHLTDDQGWRVEIKRYPKLTEIGSCRAGTEVGRNPTDIDGKRYCGFYSQSQIREVVAYAQRRNVTIVPEIEVPGHSSAALASYPELACKPGPYRVREVWGTGQTDVYCPSERTFTFLQNVLSEIVRMFPGPYVHLGGDEVATEAWQNVPLVRELMKREQLRDYAAVQAYMMRRMERYLRARNRRMVGWDEILDGGVSRETTIMSWRGDKPGLRAIKLGNDAVMTPDGPLYFDAYQGDRSQEPRAIGNMSTLEEVYDYDPRPDGVTAPQAEHIRGAQANIWTEYIDTPEYLFYMLLPRELALAEIAWVPPEGKNWDSFLARLPEQLDWLSAQRYPFRVPNPSFAVSGGTMNFASVQGSVQSVDAETDAQVVTVVLRVPLRHGVIRFTTDGSEPTAAAQEYSSPISLALVSGQRADLRAVAFLPDGRKSTVSECIVRRVSLATVKARRHASRSWAALVSP